MNHLEKANGGREIWKAKNYWQRFIWRSLSCQIQIEPKIICHENHQFGKNARETGKSFNFICDPFLIFVSTFFFFLTKIQNGWVQEIKILQACRHVNVIRYKECFFGQDNALNPSGSLLGIMFVLIISRWIFFIVLF